MFSNGSTPPPLPLPPKEEQEAASRFRMTPEEEAAQQAERDAFLAEYARTHPDGWKPEHLR